MDNIQPAVKSALTKAYKQGSSSRVVRSADLITLPGLKKAPKKRIAAILEPVEDGVSEENGEALAENEEENSDSEDAGERFSSVLLVHLLSGCVPVLCCLLYMFSLSVGWNARRTDLVLGVTFSWSNWFRNVSIWFNVTFWLWILYLLPVSDDLGLGTNADQKPQLDLLSNKPKG